MMEFLVGYLVGSSTKSNTPMTGRDLLIGLVVVMVLAVGFALMVMVLQTDPAAEAVSHVCGGNVTAICNAVDEVINSLKWVVGAAVVLIVAAVAWLGLSA
jgi:hypothetical protein